MADVWVDDRSPLAALTTVPMVLAYIHKTDGLDGVRAVLEDAGCGPGTLIEAAATFKALGLTDLARLVRQHARKRRRPAGQIADIDPALRQPPTSEADLAIEMLRPRRRERSRTL